MLPSRYLCPSICSKKKSLPYDPQLLLLFQLFAEVRNCTTSFGCSKGHIVSHEVPSITRRAQILLWQQHVQMSFDSLDIRPTQPLPQSNKHPSHKTPTDPRLVWGSLKTNSRVEHSSEKCNVHKGERQHDELLSASTPLFRPFVSTSHQHRTASNLSIKRVFAEH